MPFDKTTLYILILTVSNTLAIGGAAALLLFPRLLGAPPRRDGSSDGLDMPGTEPQPEKPQPADFRLPHHMEPRRLHGSLRNRLPQMAAGLAVPGEIFVDELPVARRPEAREMAAVDDGDRQGRADAPASRRSRRRSSGRRRRSAGRHRRCRRRGRCRSRLEERRCRPGNGQACGSPRRPVAEIDDVAVGRAGASPGRASPDSADWSQPSGRRSNISSVA